MYIKTRGNPERVLTPLQSNFCKVDLISSKLLRPSVKGGKKKKRTAGDPDIANLWFAAENITSKIQRKKDELLYLKVRGSMNQEVKLMLRY